ncbi:TM0106 family RecB-like putative nuclease [Modestobacter marinus]|uniref:TM0106 family RecB-like putative nuclease n=1 Tax=Modestobacter marinus TaxID=477641 RepID=UPI0027DF8EFC|nr:TM0106 family RecB-like putative nuclease [Modestobacter marinus]
MYVLGEGTAAGDLVVSASDLTGFLECEHLTRLSMEVARGLRDRPPAADPMTELVATHGIAHEERHVQRLRDRGLTVVAIDPPDGKGAVPLRRAQDATLAAMRTGADVVYQATFFDGTWRGHADFLLKRTDRSSALGPWAYDVADTKLARRIKVPALLQMALYGDLLARLQGVPPDLLMVVTGNQQELVFRYSDAEAYARTARERFLARLADEALGPPYPNAHCGVCPWRATCTDRWRSEDSLSLVAFMRRDHAAALAGSGIGTLAALATRRPDELPARIGWTARERLTQQARLQLAERASGRPSYEFLPREPGRGFELLPPPSAGDLFFDIEGDPFAGDDGLEYLWGLLDTAGRFTAHWGCDPAADDQSAAERTAFEALVDHLTAAYDADPTMHVYHYAPYEPTRLKTLSARLRTREAEVDRLLRGDVLVDLYAVVRQGLRLSKDSYSLKQVEDYYRGHIRAHGEQVSDAGESILAFERWLVTRDQGLLAEIEAYNRDDCVSTLQLRDWLEERRAELLRSGAALRRPEDGDPDGSAENAAAQGLREVLERRLVDGLPETGRSPEQEATWMLAQQLGWHAREARAAWWEYFRLRDLPAEELERETAALGPLEGGELVGAERRSQHWRYLFPPQETKVSAGGRFEHLLPAADGRRVSSTVVEIDPTAGWVVLSRSASTGTDHPTGLLPSSPPSDAVFRGALTELGEQVALSGIDAAGPRRAARDLLLRRAPRLLPGVPLRKSGEESAAAARRLAGALTGGLLAVQGPPGAGKTYTGARAVVDLLRTGRRVGLTASSHKVIGNLLDAVMAAAREAGVPVRALQKADDLQRCADADVQCVSSNAQVLDALDAGDVDLLAGTGWLFARADLAGRLDVLVVDEAGQLSLANALAVSRAAANLVLLGDPQQLRQPGRGIHPPGADVSALQHVLGDDEVLPADRGVFLDRSWRMAPQLCRVVSDLSYGGQLRPAPGAEDNALDVPDRWAAPAGIGWVPVVHEGNGSVSPEEAAVVAELVGDLMGRRWRAGGADRVVGQADVLVVTPYNAQVNQVRTTLAAAGLGGVEVGTVDKFQGREAAVAVFSLAASSGAHVPRRLDFLLDRHRLNVALSRAKTVAYVVGSPALLTSPVLTPEQLRLVNGLCRLVETAAAPVPA